MRVAAIVLTFVGSVLGFLVALAESGLQIGMFYFPQIKTTDWLNWITVFFSLVALSSIFLMWKWPKLAMSLLGIATIGGILGALTVWEVPGTFLFTGFILLLISHVGLHDEELFMALEAGPTEGVSHETLK